MRIYYAHCTSIYGTPQNCRDSELLHGLFRGAEVIDPSSQDIADQCKNVREDWDFRNDPNRGMSPHYRNLLSEFADSSAAKMALVFKAIAQSVDLVVFRALPDGKIPAGVAKEVQWAVEADVPVLELPWGYLPDRTMSVDATRAYLHEVGQR